MKLPRYPEINEYFYYRYHKFSAIFQVLDIRDNAGIIRYGEESKEMLVKWIVGESEYEYTREVIWLNHQGERDTPIVYYSKDLEELKDKVMVEEL